MTTESDLFLRSEEILLSSKLEGKELFGDVPVSDNEYYSLAENLKEYIDGLSENISEICSFFPVCITTFLICLAKKEYNADFWGVVCSKLGVPNKQDIQSRLGICARKTFKAYNFDISEAEGPRIYIEPILFQAGAPPISNLDQLFYILKYSNSLFDPSGLIDDLIAARSYAIRKPLLRFLERFSETRAVDFIIEAHDAIRCVDMNMSGESQYVNAYEEWKENEKKRDGISSRKKRENQARPFLKFEDGKRGLCMVLPRTVLDDEWLEEIKWIITTENGFYSEKTLIVTGNEGSRYVESITIPVCPAETYTIQLVDNEGVGESQIEPFIVKGIEENNCVFFNINGRMINPKYLPTPYCVMVASESVSINETKNVSMFYQAYPTDKKGYNIISFESTDSGSLIRYVANEKELILKSKPQISMSLEGKTLFNLPSDYGLFVEVPELTLIKEDAEDADGLILRINNSGRDIKLSNEFENNIAVISLPKTRFEKFGSYSLRIYRDEQYIKQIEMCYLPKIKTDYSNVVGWEDMQKRRRKKYCFDRKDGWELDFDNCVVKTDEESYILECPEDVGYITGHLTSTEENNNFTCSFDFPIRPYSADIVNSQGEIVDTATDKSAIIYSDDILTNGKEYWISFETFGAYKGYSYSLQLVTANGIGQIETVKGLRYGCCNFMLSVFYDTIRNNPLPAKIRLVCSNEEKEITLVTIRETVNLSKRPIYSPNGYIVLSSADDNKDLVLKKYGNAQTIKLPYSKSKLSKNGENRGYHCGVLEEGLYTIDVDNSNSNIFDFEDDSDIEFKGGKNAVIVSQRKPGSDITCFYDWLNQTVYDLLYKPADKLLNEINLSNPNDINRFSEHEISEKDCEILLALASLVSVTKNNKKRELIKLIMRKISEVVLSSNSRVMLIKAISTCTLSQEIFDICCSEYNFYLIGKLENYDELAENIEVYSEEIALLIRLKNGDSIKNVFKKSKYREIIGSEALLSMLSVPSNDDETVRTERKRFLAEHPPFNVNIMLSSDISGDFAPIQAMNVYDTKIPYLDISKRPDSGIYFNHIRYVDQYINWYKLNYDKSHEMLGSTKSKMIHSQEMYLEDIIKGFEFYKKRYAFVSRYDTVLKKRYSEDPKRSTKVAIPARFFYVLGIAAFVVSLRFFEPEMRDVTKSAERFLSEAMAFAPKMTRRDILMAETYTYLVRKEDNYVNESYANNR